MPRRVEFPQRKPTTTLAPPRWCGGGDGGRHTTICTSLRDIFGDVPGSLLRLGTILCRLKALSRLLAETTLGAPSKLKFRLFLVNIEENICLQQDPKHLLDQPEFLFEFSPKHYIQRQ